MCVCGGGGGGVDMMHVWYYFSICAENPYLIKDVCFANSNGEGGY